MLSKTKNLFIGIKKSQIPLRIGYYESFEIVIENKLYLTSSRLILFRSSNTHLKRKKKPNMKTGLQRKLKMKSTEINNPKRVKRSKIMFRIVKGRQTQLRIYIPFHNLKFGHRTRLSSPEKINFYFPFLFVSSFFLF